MPFTPLYGGVALYSGLLKNIRFFGHYELKDAQNMTLAFHDQVRSFVNDNPKDSMTGLVKDFFRSQGGQFNITRNLSQSIISYLGPADTALLVADLAARHFHQKSPLLKGNGTRDELESEILRRFQAYELVNPPPGGEQKKALLFNAEEITKKLDTLLEKFDKAMQEESSGAYPSHTLEGIVLGFFVRKFEASDLSHFLQTLKKFAPFLFKGAPSRSDSKTSLSAIQMLQQWIQIKAAQKESSHFEAPYAPIEPLISNGAAAFWNRVSGQASSKTFADCTETVLRQICNLAFYTTAGGNPRFVLPKTSSQDLKNFYDVQRPEEGNNGDRAYRDAWVKAVGDLNRPDPGFRNVLEVFIRITGVSRESFSAELIRKSGQTEEEAWEALSREAKQTILEQQWLSCFESNFFFGGIQKRVCPWI